MILSILFNFIHPIIPPPQSSHHHYPHSPHPHYRHYSLIITRLLTPLINLIIHHLSHLISLFIKRFLLARSSQEATLPLSTTQSRLLYLMPFSKQLNQPYSLTQCIQPTVCHRPICTFS